MGLFHLNYDRPGAGVSPDEPRKKGIARFCEVAGRDYGDLFRAGALALGGAVPWMAAMLVAVEEHAVFPMLLAGIVGGAVAAPQISALMDTILRCLRDEPGYWWEHWRMAWHRSAKASILPGILFGTVFAAQGFVLLHTSELGIGTGGAILLLVSLVAVAGISTYVFVQIAVLELSFGSILKNSLLLFVRYLPRALGAGVIQVVYWLVALLYYPASLLALILTSFWVPLLAACLALYAPLEQTFHIEAEVRRLHEEAR